MLKGFLQPHTRREYVKPNPAEAAMSDDSEAASVPEQTPRQPQGSNAESASELEHCGVAGSKRSPRITQPALPRNIALPPRSATRRPFASGIRWGKRLWASNPFYPISAALILYGCYRLSVDTVLLKGETPQMIFSFSSL